MRKVAVIGSDGYVGKAAARFFSRRHSVVGWDITHGRTGKDLIQECELAVVCVPTPELDDGGCDLSQVEDVMSWVPCPLVLLKSTVEPGTTDCLAKKYSKSVVFSPEFIGESLYDTNWGFEKDMEKSPWFIFGAAQGDQTLARAVCDFVTPIAGPQKKYFLTDATTAEVVKYWENCYFATKVTFVNEMARVCDVFGVDFIEAREMWAADPRVEPMHTMVFPDSPGFGGKCFPKDLAALIKSAERAGYDPRFLKEVEKSNMRFREEGK